MALLFSKQYETRVQMVKHFIISAASSWFGVLKYFSFSIHPSAVDCILHLLYGVLAREMKVQLDPIYARAL